MTARAAILPALDVVRGILSDLGLRQYDVLVRVNTWSGGIAGQGTKTTTETPLLVDGKRCKVEQVTQRDVIASGGLYQDQDLRIGPITPSFTRADSSTGGYALSALDPTFVGPNVEVLFKVTGPAYPSGAWFAKVNTEGVTGNLHYNVVVRKTGAQSA